MLRSSWRKHSPILKSKSRKENLTLLRSFNLRSRTKSFKMKCVDAASSLETLSLSLTLSWRRLSSSKMSSRSRRSTVKCKSSGLSNSLSRSRLISRSRRGSCETCDSNHSSIAQSAPLPRQLLRKTTLDSPSPNPRTSSSGSTSFSPVRPRINENYGIAPTNDAELSTS